ncbi:MAG: acetate--CoA ligase family protein [Burkholderiales bacterium]|nr:acetate--CoA ligase family protein [Burkholderiales bacterium]
MRATEPAASIVAGAAAPAPRSVYTHRQMAALVEPTSIVIVGASPTSGSFGERTLANLAQFDGEVFLVNARYERIGEQRCYPSVLDLPRPPDCAVISVGREATGKVLADCGRKGVRAAILYASGYAETGDAIRKAEQDELTALAGRYDMRIAGPNCVGLMNFARGFAMSFTGGLDMRPPAPHAVGLVSQSGAVGSAIAQWSRLGYPFSHQLTAGNSCDVDVADYVSFLADSDACRAIACVFEGLTDPQRMLQAGEAARRAGKPLIVHKIATGSRGAQAALSHTGTIAGSNEAYAALFRRIGAVVVDNVEDIAETAAFFAKAPAPRARGVGVVSISGGFCITHADKAELHGVALPPPGPALADRLAALLPDFAQAGNPCDVTGAAVNNPSAIADCCEAFLADPAFDSVVLTHSYAAEAVTNRLTGLGPAAQQHGKIACTTWTNGWLHGPGAIETASHPQVALFRSTDRCFRTLAAWYARDDWLQAQMQVQAQDDTQAPAALAAREAVTATLHAVDPGIVPSRIAFDLLERYGVPMAPALFATTASQAATAAGQLGYPVAVKIESRAIAHKTEAGGVMLNLNDARAVRAAFETVLANAAAYRVDTPGVVTPGVDTPGADAPADGVIVQPMIRGEPELMIGARIDPLFGPVVVVALGGVLVELLKDSVLELAPVGPRTALAMLDRLKGRALLSGFRGRAPIDLQAVARTISAVSMLIADQRERLAEIEINPFVCTRDGLLGIDALMVTN